ncbi:TRAP transporter substrate-binding protein [Thermodesulforhabdus norvegica]|uniref:TRAP-type C4-dicarboxylate transport system, substrate-binding protein n=1 Tax=Thermodesulforhabdus norvegica TaxID=39841 RepID=A0A1I4UI00_9BACT|nr:TRAP transporter substrate-binding protein [Thermodesulforhabdus norvegica]SFM88578.1 TRAP-type C4-dicarboxylate transport system, substrate-binding protein [Thermodesulforhabdus norvegica]
MKPLKFKRTALTMVLLIFGLPVFTTQASEVIKLNLNAIYGPTSFHTEGAVKFAELVKEYTKGTVEITVHPGGSLGFKGPELLKVVKDGQVPMSDILMGVVAGSEHVFGISSLPRLVKSYDEARKLYDECRPLYEKAAMKWNQKFLYAAPWPPSGLVTKKPVRKPEDIKGLKTRTYDKNGANFLRELGGSPVSLPWGEVYSSLRTGMIDSVLTSAESTKNGKFWEVLSYFTKINYAYPLNMVTINLDYWNALSREQQEAILKAAAEIEASQWAASEKRNEEALRIIQEQGIKVEEETPELTKAMDEAAKKIVMEFLKDASDEERKILEKYIE